MTKRYSLRKLRTGKLVLALVGSFIAVGAASTQQLTIHAQEQVQVQVQVQEQKVQLHYLSESELTPEQKQALVQLDNSQTVEQGDAVYHYVFRPQAVANQLPSTGASDNLVGMIAGASLIVLAVAVSKSKKSRRIVSMTLFTLGAGGVLSSTAIAQEVFANLVEEVTVQVGEAVPTPKAIEGYEFTGYYVREKAAAQSELPTEVVEPTTSVQPVTPEPGQPTTPVQPVTPEPEQPTTTVQPVTPEPGQPTTPVQPVTPEVPNPVEPSTPVTPDPVQPVSETGDANTEEALPEAVVHSREEMAEIPFNEIVKEDADLEVGTVKVIQEGVNGYEKKRIDIITVNNIKVDSHIEILETKDAIDKIIVKGTKVVTPVVPVTPDPVQPVSETGDASTEEALPEAVVHSREEMAEIPFKEIVKEDSDLEVGTEKVIQEGVNGYEKKRLDIITVNNIKVDTHIEILETKDAIDKIIVRGTKVVTPVTPDPVEPVVPVTPEQPTSEKGDANKEEKLPEAVVNSKEVVEDINFNEVTQEDSNLEEGTVKVLQEGSTGYTKKRIDTITVDGKVVDTREVVVETKDAKDKITVKGTKKVEPVTPTNPTTDGHVIRLSKYNDSSKAPSTPTWEYVNSLSNLEKENIDAELKGRTEFSTNEEYLKDREENIRVARELFNYKAFNESFLKLINAERATKGVNPLQLDENLIKAAQIRASEQADVAQSLRSNGKAHTRPYSGERAAANSIIYEVGTQDWQNSIVNFGENLLETSRFSENAAKMLNYDFVAQNMFNQWKASKGHYANMMNEHFTHMGVGVAQTLFSKTSGMNGQASAIGAQVFTAFDNGDLDEE